MTTRTKSWLVACTVVAGVGLFSATPRTGGRFRCVERFRRPGPAGVQDRAGAAEAQRAEPGARRSRQLYRQRDRGCNDCHTAPPFAEGGDPFMGQPEKINTAGYLAGGAAFGPFISRNLTPRANGMPANLTFEQFREVMRKGTDFKNRHPEISPLLQVMPWPVYGKMTALDIRAMYEYLSAIPSLPTPPPPPPPTQ